MTKTQTKTKPITEIEEKKYRYEIYQILNRNYKKAVYINSQIKRKKIINDCLDSLIILNKLANNK